MKLKEDILNTKDINESQYNKLLEKQQNNTATYDDILQIDRYYMKTLWKVDNIEKVFVDKYYGKNHVIDNLRLSCLVLFKNCSNVINFSRSSNVGD